MRTRPEILDDATRHTDKGALVPEIRDLLTLLTLEVLIDIRDELYEINQSLGSNIVNLARED